MRILTSTGSIVGSVSEQRCSENVHTVLVEKTKEFRLFRFLKIIYNKEQINQKIGSCTDRFYNLYNKLLIANVTAESRLYVRS